MIFNGKDLIEFGVHADERAAANARAVRSVTTQSVPGKNGDLLFDNGRYDSVTLSFDCLIDRNPKEMYNALMDFLEADKTYHRLEMLSDRSHYRMAYFDKVSGQEYGDAFSRINFTLEFVAKPQRFLKSGDIWTDASVLFNPTRYIALPLIRVTGKSGNVGIGSETVTISTNSLNHIDIDCEIMDAYCGATNANKYVTVTDYPTLHPGKNGITTSGVSAKIKPRWWEI